MKKLDMQSPNIVSENIEKIAALFPNCVTEGEKGKVIDFDLLRQELSDEIVEGNKERYRLEWPGKREAIVTANVPTQKTLRPVREDSVNFDSTQNVYIEGDNLEVLKILQESYLGKIKMIYIDPPYNTGKDFVYKDNFRKDGQDELFESGQVDEYNQRLVANPDTAGRYHSDWLTMMYPRLKLARNLLTDDGVIFISIDDNEVHNLRKVCDEVFGSNNFVANVIWERAFAPKNDAKFFSGSHDHILVFSKNRNEFKIGKLERSKEANARYKNYDNDPRGNWISDNLTVKTYSRKYDYPIITPSGRTVNPSHGSCWRVSEKKIHQLISDNRIWFGKEGNNVPRLKRFLSEVQIGMVPISIWNYKDVGHNQEGRQEVKKLFEGKGYFDGPKPVRLLARILKVANLKNNSIVLDFFSGSGSLAHSVYSFNLKNDKRIKFILAQLPEATDEKSEAYKAGYPNICEIGKERIRRAGKKIIEEQTDEIAKQKAKLEQVINGHLIDNHRGIGTGGELTIDNFSNERFSFPEHVLIDETAEGMLSEINNLQAKLDNLDTGFRVYRVDSSNMKDVYYRPQDYTQNLLDNLYNNVKEDRSAEDLLTQVLLDWGLPLSLKIEQVTIANKTVFKIAENSLFACFDKGIEEDFAKAIAQEKPLRVVFRDASFKDDTAKVNVEQMLKQLSSETEMRVI